MNINIIILICVYSCSSAVSLILFSLSYFWIEHWDLRHAG